jgi:hypothetical protein
MMMQLKLSGKLSCLKGLVVGGMTDMKDNAIPFGKFPEEIILDAVKEFRDTTWGGYGSAPKFPTFAYYEWALEQMLEGMIAGDDTILVIPREGISRADILQMMNHTFAEKDN